MPGAEGRETAPVSMQIYLVGGAVRDKLLGLPVEERDWVVVGATPEEMLARGFKQVGKDFPVFLHPQTGEEYALARTERKSGRGYTGFTVHASPDVTLEEDLRRRDLTINAMAESPEGELIDPFHGREDLNNGLLRHVSPAFAEDPVRILRVARLAARFARWGFHVAHSTHALMRKMVEDGEVDYLVPERVWAELSKALAGDSPHTFFQVLHGCGALAVLFPEIEREYPADTGAHTKRPLIAPLAALKRAAERSDDPRVRFAALVRALGGDLDAEQRVRQAEQLCERYRIPNDYRQLALSAIRLERDALSDEPERVLAFLEGAGAFRNPDNFRQLLAVYTAGGWIDEQRVQALEQARARAGAITAARFQDQDLNGPALGEAIRRERQRAIEKGSAER